MYKPSQESPSGGAGYTFAASVADALLYQFKDYARVAVVGIMGIEALVPSILFSDSQCDQDHLPLFAG